MNLPEIASQADNAYLQRDFDKLFRLTEMLIKSDNSSYASSGYVLRGGYHEYFNTSSKNLLYAAEQYKKAAELNPKPEDYVAIARALIKLGQDSFQEALCNLKIASQIGDIPEIDLAFATLYAKMEPPNYCLAKQHYFNAAKSGRVQGVFGYAMASRKLGQNFRAMLADTYRIISSPILYLFMGKKLTKGFWI